MLGVNACVGDWVSRKNGKGMEKGTKRKNVSGEVRRQAAARQHQPESPRRFAPSPTAPRRGS